MTESYKGPERREFPRYDYEKPLECKTIESSDEKTYFSSSLKGMVKNLSAAGVLFIVDAGNVPKTASLLLLELEYQTSVVCREIENRSLIAENTFLGKVVRVMENNDGTYDVGVALVPRHDPIPEDIKTLIE